MTFYINLTDVLLVQFTGQPNQVMYGTFRDEAAAWRFLFGRDYTVEDVNRYTDANWSVCNAHDAVFGVDEEE